MSLKIYEDLKKTHTEQASAVASQLPTYFTKEAILDIAKATKKDNLFIAEENGIVVGFATTKHTHLSTAEITWIGILPNKQGHGIGSKLIKAVEDKTKKVRQLLVVKTLAPVKPPDPYIKTRAFWEKQGFKLVDIIDPYHGWDADNPCALYVKP